MGLDWFRDYAPRDKQLRLFDAMLGVAAETGKPAVIHTRAADDDTLAALAGFDGTVVLHCFSSPHLLPAALERGWYVSFAGNATFPKAVDLRLAATRGAGRPDPRRDRRAVPRAAAGARQAERAGVRRCTRSRRSRRRATRIRRSSSGRSSATPPRASGCRRERRAEEAARPALPRRREHPRRDRAARGARAGRRRARGRPGPRRADALSRRARRARARRRARPRRSSRTCATSATNVDAAVRRRAAASTSRARRDEARREPAVQHRDAAPRREPRRAAGHRALVRDGAARGRRPPLRRAEHEGVRRGLGARAARLRAHGLPSGVAHGLPAAAERRLGARRVPARRRCRTTTRASSGSSRAAFAHRRKTLPNSLELAGVASRERRVRRSRRSAAPPTTRAEALAPPEFVALTRGARVRAPAPGEDQPRARRRPAARRRQARAPDRLPAHRPRRPHRDRAGRRTLRVDGFTGDTLVRDALERLAAHAAVEQRWRATIEKRIPVAAGLGGGSSDAATALRLANATLDEPLPHEELHDLAAELGADVPFFLADGPQLGTGDGTILAPLDLPQDFWIVLALPHDAEKRVDGDRLRRLRRARRRAGLGRAPRRAARRARRACAARATSPRCRRTTSRARRSPTSCARSARSAPTSAAPARPCTASSTTGGRREAAQRALKRVARTWLTAPAWYG